MPIVTIIIYTNRKVQRETIFWRKDDEFTLETGTDRSRKPCAKQTNKQQKPRIFLGIYTLQRRNTHKVSQQTQYSISIVCRFAASTEVFYAAKRTLLLWVSWLPLMNSSMLKWNLQKRTIARKLCQRLWGHISDDKVTAEKTPGSIPWPLSEEEGLYCKKILEAGEMHGEPSREGRGFKRRAGRPGDATRGEEHTWGEGERERQACVRLWAHRML